MKTDNLTMKQRALDRADLRNANEAIALENIQHRRRLGERLAILQQDGDLPGMQNLKVKGRNGSKGTPGEEKSVDQLQQEWEDEMGVQLHSGNKSEVHHHYYQQPPQVQQPEAAAQPEPVRTEQAAQAAQQQPQPVQSSSSGIDWKKWAKRAALAAAAASGPAGGGLGYYMAQPPADGGQKPPQAIQIEPESGPNAERVYTVEPIVPDYMK